jgi:signal transduction histidine kinase
VLDRATAVLGRTGIGAKLAVALALILVAALAVTFIAVYRGTGADLRKEIDRDLSEDSTGLVQHMAAGSGSSPGELARRAQRYINARPSFGSSAELLIAEVDGARPATNDPELLGLGGEPGESRAEQRAEASEARELRGAPEGYSTISLRDAGDVRVLSRPLIRDGRDVGGVTVGQSLDSVHAAQSGVSRAFLVAGSLTLIAAVVVGLLLAARLTRPLRGMVRVAGDVDAGELTERMSPTGSSETRRLAESFNHMLERLQEAFERQRAFVSDASHELRTPLTAIRGQIEVLARSTDPRPADVAATSATITREVERMERLVDDMLLLARTDEGMAPDLQPLEVGSLMSEALAGLSPGTERGLELVDMPRGTVIADGDALTQVIRNVVRNAIEHTPAGGSVRIEATGTHGLLSVSVEDQGPGIPPAERERVFARFYRADHSRDPARGGTGLGLAIAAAIVEAHGGRIWAGEAAAGGARITFEVPRFQPPSS